MIDGDLDIRPQGRQHVVYAAPWEAIPTTGSRGSTRRFPSVEGERSRGSVARGGPRPASQSFAPCAGNIGADPRVRLKLRGRWLEGTARMLPMEEKVLRRFNRYARGGPRTLGMTRS